jgi:hypothetical protein
MTQQQAVETHSEPGTEHDVFPKLVETSPSPEAETPTVCVVGRVRYNEDLISRILEKMNEAVEATAELDGIPGLYDRLQATVESGPGVSWRSLDLD